MSHLKGPMCKWPTKLQISGFLYCDANPTVCTGLTWFSLCLPLEDGGLGNWSKMLLRLLLKGMINCLIQKTSSPISRYM